MALKNTKTLKAITGGDTIKGEGKGKDGFDFVNYAKIIIASNDLPETLDKSDGFYRRAVIIDFPNQFKDTGTPIIEAIPKEEYENLGLKLIPILKNLLKRGSFHNEGTIDVKRTRFEGKSNPVAEFINTSYIYDPNSKILITDFKVNLEEWLTKRKIPIIKMNGKLFNDKIRVCGLDIDREKELTYIYGLTYKTIKEYNPNDRPEYSEDEMNEEYEKQH
jgi:phage/plasmid-associated DNA primase